MRTYRKPEPQKIQAANLRAAKYTQSLLSEGRRMRLINADQKNAIEARITAFAAQLAETDDPTALAECRQSLLYTLDRVLAAMNAPDLALYRLQIWRISELYAIGQRLLRRLYFENIALLVQVRRNRLHLPNHAYRETLDICIPAFLSQYDRKRAAHRAALLLPYQISKSPAPGKLEGLATLRRYLRSLLFENAYCKQFPEEELEALYLSYCFSRQLYDFEAPVVNFFRLTLLHALFAEYLQCGVGTLTVTDRDAALAQSILASISEEERREILSSAMAKVIDLRIPYYKIAADEILDTALHAVRRGTLPTLLVTITE